MRWIILIGRLGMVLLMTGLALGLVSLIPSAQMGFTSGASSSILPEKYEPLYTASTLTPQTGLQISIESNSSLHVYILNAFLSDFQDWTTSWVRERFPNLEDPEVWWASRNITVLNAFLEAHTSVVLWESDMITDFSKEFFPSTVKNVTITLANPSLSIVHFEYEIKSITSLAPRERILLLTELLVPVGIVLAVPWLFLTKVRKAPLQ